MSDGGWVCLYQAPGGSRNSCCNIWELLGTQWLRWYSKVLQAHFEDLWQGVMSVSLQCAAVTKELHPWSTRKDEGNEARAAAAASFLSFPAKTSQEPGSLSNVLLLSLALSPGSMKGRQEADSRPRGYIHGNKENGPRTALQLCERVVRLRSHPCIFCSLQQKPVPQLLPYCLLWTVPSASCNLNCVWRLSWKVPLGVLTIKHSNVKSPFSCLLIEMSPTS